MTQHSLARHLTRQIVMGFGLVWLLALGATSLALRSEQEELSDRLIQETAHVLLPANVNNFKILHKSGDPLPLMLDGHAHIRPSGETDTIEDAPIYRLLDHSGTALMVSVSPPGTVFPPPDTEGYAQTETHVFFTTPANREGFRMQIGDPRLERREAFFEGIKALLLPMLALLPLAYLMIGWIGRRALSPLETLRHDIEARGTARLDPIDAAGQPSELRAITSTLNGFMIRLAQALDGERAFATNAAHELRTPVAVALAQVQRMRVEAKGEETGQDTERLAAIEAALKRMSRLVTRLLQLARAEGGIGQSEDHHDVKALLNMVLDDSRRDPARAQKLHVHLPDADCHAPIDPDAFAMIAGNLIDNAFQHAPVGAPVDVSLSQSGRLKVINDGESISPEQLARLTHRFQRGSRQGDGFGLGLYIANTIARQTGGKLTLHAPPEGRQQGFEARFDLPAGRE